MIRRGGLGHQLLRLAVEGVAVAVGAGVGAVATPAVGAIARRAIDIFGPRIVDQWLVYSRTMTRFEWESAVTEAAQIPPDEAQAAIVEEIERLMPQAPAETKALATRYLTAIPGAIRRSLLSNPATGILSVPRAISTENPASLLQLLPIDPPPYATPCRLEETHFELEELIGVGGFGAVYKASSPYEQNLPRAIKFCLDPSMRIVFQHELELLERLKSDAARLPEKIVRLYGYAIDAERPFLVYEYVPGGDLYKLLASFGGDENQGLPPPLALELMRDIIEPLAYTHQRGLVHRDLKPANILVTSNALTLPEIIGHNSIKLTDFGIGGVAAVNSMKEMAQSRYLGVGQLSSTDQVSILRGAGSPLYMSPEQRRGDSPDPRHDIYSLGVIWYQLLVGSPSVAMELSWQDLLKHKEVPAPHIDIIGKCVGMLEARPADAGELLAMLPVGPPPPLVTQGPGGYPVTGSGPRSGRKFCIMCGAELTPNISFCHRCGHRL